MRPSGHRRIRMVTGESTLFALASNLAQAGAR
jgi:hypothetical protein